MNIWDWHYRIYFDEMLRQQVVEYAETLKPEEREICNETIAFYSSFYSFGILLDQILEAPAACDRMLAIACSHTEQLLRTPELLIGYYKRKVQKATLTSQQKKRLLDLLETSRNGKEIHQQFWGYLRKLFGADAERYAHYLPMPRQKVVADKHQHLFEISFEELKKNPDLVARFGACAIENFAVEILEGTAYGEWWDRELSGDEQDRLILYTSDAKVKRDDFLYTILHETYPGHGHFYNCIRNTATSMDHGANMLVEGWATYCEWYALPSAYTATIRHNGIVYLHNSYHRDLDAFAQVLWENKKRQRVPFKKALPALIYATQYIGFLESYYLGALWLEEQIQNKAAMTPKEFLEKLRAGNKGEYFRLWQ